MISKNNQMEEKLCLYYKPKKETMMKMTIDNNLNLWKMFEDDYDATMKSMISTLMISLKESSEELSMEQENVINGPMNEDSLVKLLKWNTEVGNTIKLSATFEKKP